MTQRTLLRPALAAAGLFVAVPLAGAAVPAVGQTARDTVPADTAAIPGDAVLLPGGFSYGDDIAAGRILANPKSLKMRFAAFDFGALLVPQVIGKQAALGFHHEVKTLGAVFLY